MHLIYYEVKNSTVRKYVELGKAGEYPKRKGRPPRITDAILEASNIHVAGMQTSSDIGKVDKSIMMDHIDAMVQGTVFNVSFTTEWCSHKVWNSYTKNLLPTAMLVHKYHCEEWMMFKNIN